MKKITSFLLVALLALQFTLPVFASAAEEVPALSESQATSVLPEVEEAEKTAPKTEQAAPAEEVFVLEEAAEETPLDETASLDTLEEDGFVTVENTGEGSGLTGNRNKEEPAISFSTLNSPLAGGVYNDAGAKELFYQINQYRVDAKIKNLYPLEWSWYLAEGARTRAAEYAINKDINTRPNGLPSYTVLDDRSDYYALFIAYGGPDTTAAQFMEYVKTYDLDWLRDDYPGSIGIACYTYEGVRYWACLTSYWWFGATAYDFVERMYNVALVRDPELAGHEYWWSQLLTGRGTGAQVAAEFFFSKEFAGRKLNNAAFLETLYKTYMNRASDPAGKAYWTLRLDNGVGRPGIVAQFTKSPEFVNLCLDSGIEAGEVTGLEPRDQRPDLTMFVYRMYKQCLGRDGNLDISGLNYWCGQLLGGAAVPSIAHGFVFSNEMNGRKLNDTEFLKVMYRAFMGREADAGGLAYWQNILKSGSTRVDVFNSFVYSPEFREISKNFGLTF
ncbi:DUF4214 domain-containing protein [Ruminococcaceae bacterium OttesenSCG-928-A16]|nr:DUF4214 domain-containing protein [Ruminococcaceae bacterium OttesenSCG-928-A16]